MKIIANRSYNSNQLTALLSSLELTPTTFSGGSIAFGLPNSSAGSSSPLQGGWLVLSPTSGGSLSVGGPTGLTGTVGQVVFKVSSPDGNSWVPVWTIAGINADAASISQHLASGQQNKNYTGLSPV